MEAIYIVNGARTPMGGLMGDLASVSAPELGSTAIEAAVSKAGISSSAIDEVFMGCVLPGANNAPPDGRCVSLVYPIMWAP